MARWFRGALSVGLTWGIGWVAIGLVMLAVIGVVSPEDIEPGERAGTALPILGAAGFLSGLGFAGLLSLTARRISLRDLSLTRVALCGLLGSAAIPWLMGTDASMGWVTGPVGAVFATASVLIARRGARSEAGSGARVP